MKKLMIALTMLLTFTVSANAMSYEQARNEALFLTDKMAYELNLTDDQYEAAYEVNLDYLMSVGGYDDLYGTYWQRRNMDLGYILYDWQYNIYCAANYFYRPLYWDGGYWHLGIYSRYPHRDYYYFGRPDFYAQYRGGHSWRFNGGRSFYSARSFGGGMGMRDGIDNGGSRFGGMRNGRMRSTRTTGNNGGRFGNGNGTSFGNGSRSFGSRGSYNNNGNGTSSGRSFGNGSSSFGGGRSNSSGMNSGSSSFGGGRSNSSSMNSGSSSFGGSHGGSSSSSFGGGSSSFGGSRGGSSSSSFGGSSSSFGGSRGGSSSSGFGGGSSSHGNAGGGSFGGHR